MPNADCNAGIRQIGGVVGGRKDTADPAPQSAAAGDRALAGIRVEGGFSAAHGVPADATGPWTTGGWLTGRSRPSANANPPWREFLRAVRRSSREMSFRDREWVHRFGRKQSESWRSALEFIASRPITDPSNILALLKSDPGVLRRVSCWLSHGPWRSQ
jgi:hypothetical protein